MQFFLILFFFLLLMFIHVNKMDVTSKRILYVFVVYWGIALFGANLQVFGLFKPSSEVIMIMLLSIISFVIGFLSVKIPSNMTLEIKESLILKKITYFIKSRIFKVIFICVFFYVIYIFSIYYSKLVFLASMEDARTEFFNAELFGPFFSVFNVFFLQNFVYFLCVILGVLFVYKKDIYILPIIIILMLYASLGGGRFGYIRYFTIISFTSIFLNVKLFRRNKVKVLLSLSCVFFVMFMLMSYITAARLSGEMSFSVENIKFGMEKATEQITTYSCGPILAFDYAFNNNYIESIGGYQWGKLTFSGFENYIYSILNKLGLIYQRGLESFAAIKQDSIIYVGKDISWNALYTWNLWFWCDFGILGVSVLPFLIGLFFRKCIKRMYHEQTVRLLVLNSIFLMIVFLSVPDLQVFLNAGAFLFLLILYFYKSKLFKNKNI